VHNFRLHLYIIYIVFLSFEPFLLTVNSLVFGLLSNLMTMLLLLYFFAYSLNTFLLNKKINILTVVFLMLLICTVFFSYMNGVDSFKIFLAIWSDIKFFPILIIGKLFIKSDEDLRIFLRFLTFAMIPHVIIGLLQLYTGDALSLYLLGDGINDQHQFYVDRVLSTGVFSTFLSKNYFGYACLILFLSFTLIKRNKVENALCFILFLGVLISGSRSALILALFFFFSIYKSNAYSLILCVFTMVAIATIEMLGLSTFDRLFSLFTEEYFQILLTSGRFAYLSATFAELSDEPLRWFIGLGAGNWGSSISFSSIGTERTQEIFVQGYTIPRGVFQDNWHLSIIGQFGIVVYFLCIFYFLYSYYFHGGSKTKFEKSLEIRMLTVLLISGLILPIISMKYVMITVLTLLSFSSLQKNK
jgi:hypothetical protein